MSTSYVVALVVLVVAIGLARVVLPVLPWRLVSVRLHPADVALAVLGVLGLAFLRADRLARRRLHCARGRTRDKHCYEVPSRPASTSSPDGTHPEPEYSD